MRPLLARLIRTETLTLRVLEACLIPGPDCRLLNYCHLLLLLTLSEHHLTTTHTTCTRALASRIALRSLLLVLAVVGSTLGELWLLSVVKRYRLVASAGDTLSGGLNSSGGRLIL